MIDRGEIKAFVRNRSKLHFTSLESKLARTFSDDVDVRHGADSIRGIRSRPGQRDDEPSRAFHALLTI